jgi:hypothetical protein
MSTRRVLLLCLCFFAWEARAAPADPPPTDTVETRWSQPLPFQRLVDVQLEALFFPDAIGLCLQVHPWWFLSVEACAGTVVLYTTVHGDAILPVLHYTRLHNLVTDEGRRTIRGWEVGFGPWVGIRGVLHDNALKIPPYAGVDVGVSVEGVYWFHQHLGLKVQLDGGAMFGVGTGTHPALPVVESKIGVAF